ncbi:uncharacterized protein PHACADRAFT_259136 [Phanerochaete carnosa HHB-10118-sp]|uniref:Uncharacterized protein n=1 Tax=Phanerochaete carnosa (strain HHB-10118-sp) TaxID=650164 RepID=K5VND2_PHACS|nr:uncharacterized protein PHACADRAFT_259136 [Phanerochaete carnosa HHB-10118-sp]EKM52963.1 hypothetical protein PHACADRAFT_259136 [Phanerochaete carnosa HHB-10118-sp]
MVDWWSPETIELCALLFGRLIVLMLGMYLWFFILTFRDVEWGLITRRLQISVAICIYLIGRYCLLTTLIMLFAMNQLNELMKLVCDTAGSHSVTALAVLGNMALVSASTNLQLRALTLWKGNIYICALLVTLCAAHWVFCIERGCFLPRGTSVLTRHRSRHQGLWHRVRPRPWRVHHRLWDCAPRVGRVLPLYGALGHDDPWLHGRSAIRTTRRTAFAAVDHAAHAGRRVPRHHLYHEHSDDGNGVVGVELYNDCFLYIAWQYDKCHGILRCRHPSTQNQGFKPHPNIFPNSTISLPRSIPEAQHGVLSHKQHRRYFRHSKLGRNTRRPVRLRSRVRHASEGWLGRLGRVRHLGCREPRDFCVCMSIVERVYVDSSKFIRRLEANKSCAPEALLGPALGLASRDGCAEVFGMRWTKFCAEKFWEFT